MEFLILIGALSLAAALALVKNFQYSPSELSEFELARRADEGDGTAAYELYRRPLLSTLAGLRSFKVVLLTSLLATLLVATHQWWLGLIMLLGLWLLAELAAAKGWLASASRGAQRFLEPRIIRVVAHASAVLKHLAPHHAALSRTAVGSRQELLHIIGQDTTMLTAAEKARVQAALAFGTLTVADAMVKRDDIATVEAKETVGPVLLDKLHKQNHKVFVVIKKDLDDVQGLLYMSDATSGHPDIKTVKDALRPTVHYVPQDAPLQDILAASLRTGRQLFIAVDHEGHTKGLITLADALARLGGGLIASDVMVGTEPNL